MISSATDLATMGIRLYVHGARLDLTVDEAKEVITTLAHAVMPIDSETQLAVFRHILAMNLDQRRKELQ